MAKIIWLTIGGNRIWIQIFCPRFSPPYFTKITKVLFLLCPWCESHRTALECDPQRLEKPDTNDIHLYHVSHPSISLLFSIVTQKEPRQFLVLVSSLCVRVKSALQYTGDTYLWHVISVPSECQSVLYRSISSDCLCCPDWSNLFDFIFFNFLSSSWVYKLPGVCSNVCLFICVSLAFDT